MGEEVTGDFDGISVGADVTGADVGPELGACDGLEVGNSLGTEVGLDVTGAFDGLAVAKSASIYDVGPLVIGAVVGPGLGADVTGAAEGTFVGIAVGMLSAISSNDTEFFFSSIEQPPRPTDTMPL